MRGVFYFGDGLSGATHIVGHSFLTALMNAFADSSGVAPSFSVMVPWQSTLNAVELSVSIITIDWHVFADAEK